VKGTPNYREIEATYGYSYHYIRQLFRRITKISLSRYVLARKIENIAFEIRHTNKYFVDIAYEYAFTNPDTFTKAFRRIVGINPSEFKVSNHSCGRRIICASVYAPVILDHNNPKFTLPKLKAINEFGEMIRTPSSCILYGVPKVYFGREDAGAAQWTPFPMCLQSVLNYMGQDISYSEIMAYSGAAFRQRWDTAGWNVAAVDIRFTYESHLRPFELAFKCAGRSFNISERPDKPKSIDKDNAFALIRSELDCGRPVIALGVVGPPEACIVTGYKNNGEALLGWSLFQENTGMFGGDCRIDESGYFLKDNWWDNTEAIISLGEDIKVFTSVKDVLANALMLMTQERVQTYGGTSCFYGGQAAYEAWAKAVENDSVFLNELTEQWVCQKDSEVMLEEGRGHAALYLLSLVEKYPNAAETLMKCAKRLKTASEIVPQIRTARKANDNAKIAALIRQAANHEKKACTALKQAIGKL